MKLDMTFSEYFKKSQEVNEANKGTYKEFFKGMLKKYKIKSPSELSKEDKVKFYDEIDTGWDAENETDLDEGFDITYVQKDFDFIVKMYEIVTDVSYDKYGEVIIKGKSKLRKDNDYVVYKGNAQLAGNLAKAVADHFNLKEPKMI